MSIQRKLALSSFDLHLVAQESNNTIKNARINMINSSKQGMIIKLHVPDTSVKYKLVLGQMVTFTTQFDIQSISSPSQFITSCRKHLANLSLLHIQQVNFDRTLIFVFGRNNEPRKILIQELFGKGNIILTSPDLKVITSNLFQKNPVYKVFPGQTIDDIYQLLSFDKFQEMVELAKTAKGQKNQLRYVLASNYYIGGATASIVLRYCQLSAGVKCSNAGINLEQVYDYLYRIMIAMKESLENNQGFIYYYREDQLDLKDIEDDAMTKKSIRVAEFHPINMNLIFEGLYDDSCIEKKNNFIETLDEYFNLVNSAYGYQMRASLISKQVAKHENLQSENQNKVDQLLNQALYYRFLGDICILNSNYIDKLLDTIREQFSNKVITWSNIEKQMNQQQNTIFNFIQSVDLIKKIFTINIVVTLQQVNLLSYKSFQQIQNLLQDEVDNDQEEVQLQSEIYNVDVFINDKASLISRRLFDLAKNLEVKAGRTTQQTEEAVTRITKISQQNITKILKETEDQLTILTKQRLPMWFEKFNWFISSEGYLVLAGRDAQSNEMLVKKFMNNDDIFIHADVHGAACTVIKTPKLEKRWQPPLNTLNEASTYAITHSRLWETGVSSQSYWVYGDQVSKTAPTGLYVGTGSFVVRGKRNFLSIANLKLGLFLLYRYNDTQQYFIQKQPEVLYNDFVTSETVDNDQKITVVQTKKQKFVQVTAQDQLKQNHKEERKEARKERQKIVAEMRFKAKLKRLEAEGRAEDIQKSLDKKQVKQQEIIVDRQDYCILCGSNHCYEECLKFTQDELIEDSQDSIQSSLLESESSDITETITDVPENQYALVQQAYNLSPDFIAEKQPTVIISLCPLASIPATSKFLEITPGTIIRSSCGKVIKEWSIKQYSDNPYVLQGIKNIQDQQIMVAIPGRCQFQGFGVGRILQNVSKQQVSKQDKKLAAKERDAKQIASKKK